MYTIAILDEEQKERDKFLNFFENSFNVIELIDITNIDSLIERIKSDKIDALAIDYKLKDHGSLFKENGDYFFKLLIERFENFPSFILTQDPEHAKLESKKINPFFIIDKAKLVEIDKTKQESFIKDIHTMIESYKHDLELKFARFNELETIKNSNENFVKYENEYLELSNSLSKSITGTNSIPLKYFSKDTNEKLDKIISKTEALINKISNTEK